MHAVTTATRHVDVDGNYIGYRSIGAGPPILLVNRFRGTLDTWDPLFLDRLADRHRVITFDYPGVGYSGGRFPQDMAEAAAAVAAFATAIDVQQFAMLAWSFGGFVGQSVLTDHPDRVTHAILVGTNPPGPNPVPIAQAFLDRALKPVNDLADEEVLFFEPVSAFSRSAAKSSHDRIHARPGVASRIPSSPEAIQAYLVCAADHRTDAAGRREMLTRTHTPILVLCGDNDISNPTPNWFPLVGRMPTAQVIVYPSTGHAPQHQHPEMTVDYIDVFLRRT